MRLEKISEPEEAFITVDDFSRGINENSGEEARILKAENVCLKGKKAVSRLGMKADLQSVYLAEAQNTAQAKKRLFPIFVNGEYKKLFVFEETDDATYVKYIFKMTGEEETDMGDIRFTPASAGSFCAPSSVFVFSGAQTHGNGIYAVFSFHDWQSASREYYMKIYEYSSSEGWQILSESDIYLPTVYKNGRGVTYELSGKTFDAPEFPEQPNMLSEKTRFCFNADGVSDVFYLPIDELKDDENSYISVSVELANGTKLSFTVNPGSISSQNVAYGEAQASVTVDRAKKKLQFFGFAPPYIEDKTNTIEVTVSQPNIENIKKYANMKFGIWYNAGNSLTRLFAAGNDLYPSLIIASAPNNPLYFPENNQFYVGEPTQKITALARQNKSLVVFKEKEIYCGAYSSDKFSVTHLHSEIGCDLPATVALCGNRVVWATTDKCIYTLNALSDYGAVAVYRISSKIENTLAKFDFSEACSAYKDDVYYLFLKDKACIMNVSGALLQSNKQFLESASFTFWNLPDEVTIHLASGVKNGIKAVCSTKTANRQIIYTCSFSGNSCFDEVLLRDGRTDYHIEKKPFYSVMEFYNCPNIKKEMRSFLRAYVNCFAENGVEAQFGSATGDMRKISRIDIKYTRLKFPVPYRILTLIGARALVTKFVASGEFALSGYTLYYRDFI